ncbi:hypothetical protein E3N88_24902 [Mikania micrantha]|uniref:TPX2 central domain-containing protein n=1 Tax=Mikania micrantha TaxID=192012 RepID=A0A5N6N3G5_9ASTR|nr:hypothetical protein E3N88_24902 [Mikania micrantha]
MEVEMEDDNSSGNTAVEFTFTAVEIDIDYEFDAARFFDFTKEESIDEARTAERWFDSAESYPPSPFAVRLLSREQSENANGATSKGSANAPEHSSWAGNRDSDVANEGVHLDFKNHCPQSFQKQQYTSTSTVLKQSIRNDNCKSKTKSSWKSSFARTSTLMKPTASQLAKQNLERLIDNSRLKKSGNNSTVVESQAAKRQKLEGGHLCKGTDTNQQANFVHKAPKRDGNADDHLGRGRLRITVPRSPDLATAQRAQMIRKKDISENEHGASLAPKFRARPFNRKIFEPPSFLHQKSTPRVAEFQQIPHKSSFAFGTGRSSREPKGPHFTGFAKQEDCDAIHRFKALPLNKKILSSKGDIGVFRSRKHETTVAMMFNFQTEKRAHAPPVDLFNKLSLTSESSSQSSKPAKLFRPHSILSKKFGNRLISSNVYNLVLLMEDYTKRMNTMTSILAIFEETRSKKSCYTIQP